MPKLDASDLLDTKAMEIRFPWFRQNFWAHLRCRGDGPPFRRIGGLILYREGEVLAWIEGQTFTSTQAVKRRRVAATAAA